MTECDEVFLDTIATKKTNTIATKGEYCKYVFNKLS